DQFDPAVAAGGLARGLGRQLVGRHLDADVAQVPLGRGDVPAGPRQPRDPRLVVEFRVRVRGTGVADREYPRAAVDRGQLPCLVDAADRVATRGDADV